MKGTMLENKSTRPSYKEDNLDYDMAFSKSLREKVPINFVLSSTIIISLYCVSMYFNLVYKYYFVGSIYVH